MDGPRGPGAGHFGPLRDPLYVLRSPRAGRLPAQGADEDGRRPGRHSHDAFRLVKRIETLRAIDLPYPLFAKPVAEGTGKGITADSKIKDREALRRVCGELLARCRQPVLAETFLPGREFTVGILGTGDEARVIGSMEITSCRRPRPRSTHMSTRAAGRSCAAIAAPWGDDAEVAQAEQVALAAHRTLGCRDASRVDIRSDGQGRPHFMEVNPSPASTPKIPICPSFAVFSA